MCVGGGGDSGSNSFKAPSDRRWAPPQTSFLGDLDGSLKLAVSSDSKVGSPSYLRSAFVIVSALVRDDKSGSNSQ